MEAATLPRKFSDRELAALSVHLDSVTVPDLNQQAVHNALCERFGLSRFTNMQVSQYVGLNPKPQEYDLDASMIAYLVSALNKPMSGRLARVVGAGSPFFSRLTEDTESKTPLDRQAAVPTEPLDLAVVQRSREEDFPEVRAT